MTDTEIRDFIDNAIKENKVMLFMKGTPEQPRCGFSMRTSGALNALGVQYAALDILPDPRIREELSSLSGWPTIPQLFIDGELVGGCDIVTEMYETGELADKLGVEMPEDDDGIEEMPVEQGPGALGEPPGLMRTARIAAAVWVILPRRSCGRSGEPGRSCGSEPDRLGDGRAGEHPLMARDRRLEHQLQREGGQPLRQPQPG